MTKEFYQQLHLWSEFYLVSFFRKLSFGELLLELEKTLTFSWEPELHKYSNVCSNKERESAMLHFSCIYDALKFCHKVIFHSPYPSTQEMKAFLISIDSWKHILSVVQQLSVPYLSPIWFILEPGLPTV